MFEGITSPRGCCLGRTRVLKLSLSLITLVMIVSSTVVHAAPAPDFTLTDVDGRVFSLRDFRGKVVILDFFATYCQPCRDEMAELKAVRTTFGSKVVIVSISIYESISNEELKQFKADYGMSWTVAKDTAKVYVKYSVSTVPTLHIIDQGGSMKYKHIGLTDSAVLSEEIRSLMSLTLTVRTSSGLNNVHFKVDGTDYYTSAGSLSVDLNGGVHQVQLVDETVKDGNDIEYRFLHWSGIASGSSNPLQIDVATSSVLEADFQKYCKIAFTQSGSEVTPDITVDGKSYALPRTFWFESSSSHSFNYQQVSGGTGIQYVPTSTSSQSPITVARPTTVVGDYETQYYVTVISDYGKPTPSQWVDKGEQLVTQVTSPAEDNVAGRRHRCTGYTVNDGSLRQGTSYKIENIQGPQKVSFEWTLQYYLGVATDPSSLSPQPVISPRGLWQDEGTSISCEAQEVYSCRFVYWILDGEVQEEGKSQLTIQMDRPHRATAYYKATTDLNFDGKVDQMDMAIIAAVFKSASGDGSYDPKMDFDNNGIISIMDISVVAKDFAAA